MKNYNFYLHKELERSQFLFVFTKRLCYPEAWVIFGYVVRLTYKDYY